MTNQPITRSDVMQHADRISAVLNTLAVQNDFINLVQDPKEIEEDTLRVHYSYLYRALGNIHELNQGLIKDLDSALCTMYDLAEERGVRLNETH